jgi:hypothetical protein
MGLWRGHVDGTVAQLNDTHGQTCDSHVLSAQLERQVPELDDWIRR